MIDYNFWLLVFKPFWHNILVDTMATPRTRAIARAVVEAEVPHRWEDAFQTALESCGANLDMTSIFKWYHEGSKRYYEWCFLMAGEERRQVDFLRKTKLLIGT